MTRTLLRLRQPPTLRVDMRGITPAALAPLTVAEIERLTVTHGHQTLALAECFSVSKTGPATTTDAADELRLEGDLQRCDRIGWQMLGGRLVVEGTAGDYAGACMSGGDMQVCGNAGLLAACEMAGGTLRISGSVGDFAASTLPGSMDGMRGGTFIVHGNAGARFADRMRRGTAVVMGDAGDFLASRLVAGTIALGGRAGAHVGYGMRRGTVVFAGPQAQHPPVPPTFVRAVANAEVIWQLLARDLAQHGGPFNGLAARRMQRHLGDVAAAGKGELVFAL